MSAAPYALTVIKPISVADSMLVSSTVPEADHAVWSSTTTYALGDRVIKTHKVYESLQDGNLDYDPAASVGWWIEVGPTNRWKVFDTINSTATTQAAGIEYVLSPGQAINSVAVLNVVGAGEIVITMTDPTYGVVYSKSIDMTGLPSASDWWSWLFGSRVSPTLSIATDIPSYPSAQLKITITGGNSLSVGVIMLGQKRQIGLGVQLGATVGIQDYSRKETNEFGDTVLVQRAYSKRASFHMLLEKPDVDSTVGYLSELRATPCLWIGSEIYESTVIYGFFKDFQITISYPTHSDCSLEIEGLT